jgi:hypothetical protein
MNPSAGTCFVGVTDGLGRAQDTKLERQQQNRS